jgi:chromosome segregation ATPase
MSTTVPQREAEPSSPPGVSGSAHELLLDDNELRKQLESLARDNEQLLAALGIKSPTSDDPAPATDVATLQAENQILCARIAELEKQSGGGEATGDAWAEQQKEYEALLEEKSEVIRSLHQKIQELREGGAVERPAGEPAQSGEIEDLKARLEAEREQLRQDEETLMQQMTQMEMTMSRERAEMARQRNELQRLYSDIKHELEVASRDATLRDRLATFQRRHQEFSGRKNMGGSGEAAAAAETQEPAPQSDTTPAKKNTGILKRFFG